MRRGERTTALKHLGRHQLLLFANRLKSLPLQTVFVRRIEQLREQRLKGWRQPPPRQIVDIGLFLFGQQAFFLDAGQRRAQRIGRRRLVAALALLVKIHRCAMQAQQQAGRLQRTRYMAEVFAAERFEREFIRAATLPHEIDINLGGGALRGVHERSQRGLIKTQHHGTRLDLGTLAVRRLDLQRAIVVGQDGADLKATVLFVKYIHMGNGACRGLRKARIIAQRPRPAVP